MGESVPSTFQNLKLMSAEVTAKVARFVNDSLAENTRKAYLSDLSEFERWGGSIPASAETVAAYMAARADTLAVASIVRHVASISKAHEARGLPNPTRSELVRATMRGIKRTRGCAQREAKPLLRDDLLLVLDAMGDGLKDIRDRALLLIGFAGALRRSELVGLDVGDIEHVRQGVVLHLRRSKTDQDGQGRKIGIPFGRSRWCVTVFPSSPSSAYTITSIAISRSFSRIKVQPLLAAVAGNIAKDTGATFINPGTKNHAGITRKMDSGRTAASITDAARGRFTAGTPAQGEAIVSGYKVLIDDNFHFMDESERVLHGVFATADEAIVACKLIVDECLKPMLQPGMTATALYEQYNGFGDDPFIVPVDPNDAPLAFSAWEYAKERCEVLGAKTQLVFPPEWENVTEDCAETAISIVGVKPTQSS
jgi:site-specific recombinase XerC